jgi:outer membrane protein assembly factor BamB
MRLLGTLFLAATAAAPAQNVLAQHNDIARTGANLHEIVLTFSNVKTNFGSLFSPSVDGQIYAQPLVVNGVEIPGKRVHNVVYVATMKNNVYAFDADHPDEDCPLWKRNLGKPVPYKMIPLNWGSIVGQYNIKPFMGITSTPVIDPDAGRIWVVAKTLAGDDDIRYYLYALDIKTGAVLATSQPIQSEVGSDKIEARNVLQRPGLLRANGMVYLAFGSEFDGGIYHGWLVAFDEQTSEQKYVFCSTPGDLVGEGGIWQAGNGPAADADGNIHVMTGNGAYDPDKQRYGSSFIKLSPQLKVLDWFTPSNYVKMNVEHLDLGSAGPLLIPDSDQIVGGGKQGIFYLLSRGSMGHLQPNHSVAPALQQFQVSNRFSLKG